MERSNGAINDHNYWNESYRRISYVIMSINRRFHTKIWFTGSLPKCV
eukprot:gene5492-6839_t